MTYFKWMSFFALLMALPLYALQASQSITITANAFEFDGAAKTIQASGNVRVTHKDVVITGTRAHYQQVIDKIYIEGPVKVTRGPFHLTCKHVTAYMKEQRIEANEDVKFDYEKLKGQSEKADYDVTKQRVILTGNPIAWQNQDQLRGKLITVDLKTKRVRTTGQAHMIITPESLNAK